MSEILLINVSGEDRRGLTSSLTGILAQYGVKVLDIGQAVIHETLSLGMLIEIPEGTDPAPVLKDLVFRAHELEVDLRFTPVTPDEYEEWVGHQESKRYIITLLGRQIARREEIRLEQTIAVGDGANDLPMLNRAGLGIAFHARPVVREGAKQAISTLGLDGVFYLMGIRDRETRI